MTIYPIGTRADKIVGLTVDREGVFTHVRRQLATDGRFVDVASIEPVVSQADAPVEFVVRVDRDHSGILEITPESARSGNASTIIPLGPRRPFLESELPPCPGADGAFSLGCEMHFQFSDATLTWTSFNLSGRIKLGEHVPAVSVLLRLPADHDGELVFVIPHDP